MFEAEEQLQIRPMQHKVAKQLMDSPKGLVEQLNMVGSIPLFFILTLVDAGFSVTLLAFTTTIKPISSITPCFLTGRGQDQGDRANACLEVGGWKG